METVSSQVGSPATETIAPVRIGHFPDAQQDVNADLNTLRKLVSTLQGEERMEAMVIIEKLRADIVRLLTQRMQAALDAFGSRPHKEGLAKTV